MKYVILGSGIAGMAAAEAIRETEKETGVKSEILMISAEKELCFNRPMLIGEFSLDGSGADLFEKQQDWPAQQDVQIRLGAPAEAIDRKKKLVRLADGSEENYDKLIYALGAEVTIPPIPGADRDSVFVVRTREDMRRIREAMRKAGHAVVIGGGMLGLEDAWGLFEQKLEVAVIERQQRVAFGQIDQSAGNLMKKRIERMGVPVYVNAEVTEIGDGYVTFLQRTAEAPAAAETACAGASAIPAAACPGCCGCGNPGDCEAVTIPADLVILSTGVTPNSALGQAAGLKVTGGDEGAAGEESGSAAAPKWIAVDDFCRTSDPDIFAAGDAAAVNGRNDAIWDEARAMGRVAGRNAALSVRGTEAPQETAVPKKAAASQAAGGNAADTGSWACYRPVTPEHVFTGFDTEVFTMADSSGAGTDGVYIRHADVEIFDYQRERYIRVSLQDGKMAGVLLINASELAPELMEAYQSGAGEEEARQIILKWKDSHEVDFKPAEPFRHRQGPEKSRSTV